MSRPPEVVVRNLKHCTLTVTARVSSLLCWRLRIGLLFIRLGAWIASTRFALRTAADDQESDEGVGPDVRMSGHSDIRAERGGRL